MNFPNNLKYSEDHEWISLDGNTATVGITEFASSELGDIVFIEIETQGETLAKGETFGTVEAVKTVSDLFMPAGGEITEVNPALNDNPEIVNKDPYGEGWLIKIKLSDTSEVDGLMSADEYKEIAGG
jgi:glycine cleavage system H protein